MNRFDTDIRPADPVDVARRALAALDLTRLEDRSGRGETDAVAGLCARAATPFGTPAAVCVYPEFIPTARRALKDAGIAGRVRIASVANFPSGDAPVETVRQEIDAAIEAGADEIDVVFPYRSLLEGNDGPGRSLVGAARAACRDTILKIILETGALAAPSMIDRAARIALDGGADFLKTSTGKVAVNATPEAAALLLELIAETGSGAGLKVSGGIRDLTSAGHYFALADRILGPGWASPARFRIGASGLLDDIVGTLRSCDQ